LIFPVLNRVRTLARRTSTLALAEQKTGVEIASEPMILSELAGRVTRNACGPDSLSDNLLLVPIFWRNATNSTPMIAMLCSEHMRTITP
jgi:hypothetical protein